MTETDKSSWKKYFRLTSRLDFSSCSHFGQSTFGSRSFKPLHSISVIPDIHGTPIRGSLRTIFYGDTKTSKSQAIKDVTTDHYSFGELIIGESSSRTGITYSIDKSEMEDKFNISDVEFSQIVSDLDNNSVMILDAIKVEPQSSTQLAERLDVSAKTIKRRYSPLSKHRLIRTKQGKGITLTPRGVTFLKKYHNREKEIRTLLEEKVASGLNTPMSQTTQQNNYQQDNSDEFMTTFYNSELIHEKVQKNEEAIKKIFRVMGNIDFDSILAINISYGYIDACLLLADRELRI